MKTCRILITGASGAGVTSLGRALADALTISHHDTDDYFWRQRIRLIARCAKSPIVSG
jgi:adenylate kinase family enzyme